MDGESDDEASSFFAGREKARVPEVPVCVVERTRQDTSAPLPLRSRR